MRTSGTSAERIGKLQEDRDFDSARNLDLHHDQAYATRFTHLGGFERWSNSLCGLLLFLIVALMLGCTSVVTPLQPGNVTAFTNPDHGLVLARMHLVWNGKDQRAGAHVPFDVRWNIRQEESGTQLVINHVPVDGPLVLELPAGSYRLVVVSLDNALGVWQTSLPATFTVQPKACTYLGTWELQMETEFYSGSMARQVLDQPDLAQRDLRAIIGDNHVWPLRVAQLEAPIQSPLVLTFRTQGTDLTSPP
ncbi:MAG: hypothetical protein U0236_03025 [Nitrospira sp.]